MPYSSKQGETAYILSSVKSHIDRFLPVTQQQIMAMYKAISNFEMIANFQFDDKQNQSNAYRLEKVEKIIVQRGCPTLSLCFVERLFATENERNHSR